MKKSLKIVALGLSMALAVTFEGCSSNVSGGNNNDSGNNSDTEKPNPTPAPIATYTVTYVDGVDDEEITVPSDSTAYHTGDTVTIKFDGIGSRSGFKFVGWSDGTTTYSSTGTTSFTMGSANVTLTAQWTVVYYGTKAPTEAKAVGDIVFEDGSATPYTTDLSLTEDQKLKAIAVIFYAGDENDMIGARTLGVGVTNTGDEKLYWSTPRTGEGGGIFTYVESISGEITRKPYGGSNVSNVVSFVGDTDGSDNWSELCNVVNDWETIGNYPAWEWANSYPKTDNLDGNWYLPTIAELCMLHRSKTIVNNVFKKIDGTEISNKVFWASSQQLSSNKVYVWFLNFNTNGDLGNDDSKYRTNSVCAIREFE